MELLVWLLWLVWLWGHVEMNVSVAHGFSGCLDHKIYSNRLGGSAQPDGINQWNRLPHLGMSWCSLSGLVESAILIENSFNAVWGKVEKRLILQQSEREVWCCFEQVSGDFNVRGTARYCMSQQWLLFLMKWEFCDAHWVSKVHLLT